MAKWYCHLLYRSRSVGSNLTWDLEIFQDDTHLLPLKARLPGSLSDEIQTEDPCLGIRNRHLCGVCHLWALQRTLTIRNDLIRLININLNRELQQNNNLRPTALDKKVSNSLCSVLLQYETHYNITYWINYSTRHINNPYCIYW